MLMSYEHVDGVGFLKLSHVPQSSCPKTAMNSGFEHEIWAKRQLHMDIMMPYVFLSISYPISYTSPPL